MKKRIAFFARMVPVASLLLTMLAGCLSVDYVGQDFPPLPEGREVLFFDAKRQPPAGEYQAIGRGSLVVPRGYDGVEIREKFAEAAREHGASAVRIVSVERRQINRYYAEGGESASPMLASSDTVGAFSLMADGSPAEVDSFGEVVSPNRTYSKEYEQFIKVLFLMKERDYRRAVEERRRAAQEK